MQVLRGLLKYKSDSETFDRLVSLRQHPNEIVRDVIDIEIPPEALDEEVDHSISPEDLQNLVVEGDVLEVLVDVPDRSIHLTFTSPPYYNARDYSIYRSYSEYLSFLEKVFKEIYRITKTGRYFVLNTSPVIFPRPGRKYSSRRYPVLFDIHPILERMGWVFIDDIVWAKPAESSKNRVAGFEVNRKPLTYKANARTEYVMVYRKKSHRLIDWNLKQYSSEVIEASKVDDQFERTNIWEISPSKDRVHSAVFPIELCDQVVKLYSFQGDLVFDPFAGSGSLARAALGRNRKVFMTEIREDYISRIAEKVQGTFSHTDQSVKFMNSRAFKLRIKSGG